MQTRKRDEVQPDTELWVEPGVCEWVDWEEHTSTNDVTRLYTAIYVYNIHQWYNYTYVHIYIYIYKIYMYIHTHHMYHYMLVRTMLKHQSFGFHHVAWGLSTTMHVWKWRLWFWWFNIGAAKEIRDELPWTARRACREGCCHAIAVWMRTSSVLSARRQLRLCFLFGWFFEG